ncbi:MAG: ABC transporter substrate-binding protein [Cyanobacteria bacterium J06642_2]
MIPIHLQLDWKPNAQFAGILWAHHQGWYQNIGIDLHIHPWEPYVDPVSALERDGFWIVSTEDNLLIRARERGLSAQAIAAMMQYSGLGWIALKSSNISSIADLKGKRIGIHGDGETGLKVSLAQFGLSADDVDIVEIGYDYPQLLRSGDFDAVQCLVMVEPLELAHEGFELNVMPAYEWGYEVYSQVLATSKQAIASAPKILTHFLAITFEGWRHAFAHPQDAIRVVVDEYLRESSHQVQTELLLAMQPLFEGKVGQSQLGWMTPERWQKSIDYLKTYGVIQTAFAPEEVMTNDLMAAACARC